MLDLPLQNRLVAPMLAASLLLAITGCGYSAPKVSGDDQVQDGAIEATALKDNGFNAMTWPAVDDIMAQLVPDPGEEPGCALGVVRDDEIIYLKGYGYARLPDGDAGELWGMATMGAVGSISKTITAAAVMHMYDRGLLDANARVDEYLTTTNGPLASTRIYELLRHSSGVGGDTLRETFAPNWEPDSLVQVCKDEQPPFHSTECQALIHSLARPANAFGYYEDNERVDAITAADMSEPYDDTLERGVYSNVGYSVLGAIVDKIARDQTTSDGYEAYVWDHIGMWSDDNELALRQMLSLALTHSWRATDIPHRAIGYRWDEPERPETDTHHFEVLEAWERTEGVEGWEGPAGGWALTIGDLARFMIALDNGDFFDSSGGWNAMRMAWSDIEGLGDDNYGFGLFVGSNNDAPFYWHGGAIGGHQAFWGWFEDFAGKEIGIATICNRSDANMWTQKRLAPRIASVARWGDPVVP